MRKNNNLPAHMDIMTATEALAYKAMPNPEPIEPGTLLITRQGIEVLADVNRTRVCLVSNNRRFNFPPIVCLLSKGLKTYDAALVIEWLKHNDLNAIKFTRDDYTIDVDEIMPRNRSNNKETTLDATLAQHYLATAGIKPPEEPDSKPAKKTKKITRQTVHVSAVHAHENNLHINAWMRRGGNHRIAIAGNWD